MPKISTVVCTHNRVVITVGKEILVCKPHGSCSQYICCICVNKPTDLRIVITAGYIVEPRFVVVVVATVTKRIKIGKGRAGSLLIDDAGSGRIGNPNQLAPCVIGVGGVGLLGVAGDVAVGILDRLRAENLYHVALLVQGVEIVGKFDAVVLGILDRERGRLRAPPVADTASKKEWPQSKFEAAVSAAYKFWALQQEARPMKKSRPTRKCALRRA